jgi:hypothetical protein
MMAKYKNSKKLNFLSSIPTTSLDDKENDLTARCKFNFSYFTLDKAIPLYTNISPNNIKLFS